MYFGKVHADICITNTVLNKSTSAPEDCVDHIKKIPVFP